MLVPPEARFGNHSCADPDIDPDTSSRCDGVLVPIPTLLPVTTNAFVLYLPTTIRSSENTSKIGRPETSDTTSNDPLKLSSTANSLPFMPSTLNKVDPELTIESDPDTLILSLLSK